MKELHWNCIENSVFFCVDAFAEKEKSSINTSKLCITSVTTLGLRVLKIVPKEISECKFCCEFFSVTADSEWESLAESYDHLRRSENQTMESLAELGARRNRRRKNQKLSFHFRAMVLMIPSLRMQ